MACTRGPTSEADRKLPPAGLKIRIPAAASRPCLKIYASRFTPRGVRASGERGAGRRRLHHLDFRCWSLSSRDILNWLCCLRNLIGEMMTILASLNWPASSTLRSSIAVMVIRIVRVPEPGLKRIPKTYPESRERPHPIAAPSWAASSQWPRTS